jgi:catechol 2,3-dioxygenase-like lactoylglutathione lyase family enzyme
MKIDHVTILVKDQDEATNFYVQKLGFKKQQDTVFWGNMRWVTVSSRDQPEVELTFVKADSEDKLKAVGKQAGDHVFLTLETDNCRRDYKEMKAKGVKFYGEPAEQPYGVEVVFEDLYGNLIDLIQRRKD